MRQVYFTDTGEPEVLQTQELSVPKPNANQVLIRVAYAAVNNFDIMARRSGYGGIDLPYAPGLEVSGYVHSIGDGVTSLGVGDEVAAFVGGGG
jgi:NADPH2:quinone reductase